MNSKPFNCFRLLIAGVFFMTFFHGSSQSVYSIFPPFAGERELMPPAIEGLWALDFFGKDTLTISRTTTAEYIFAFKNSKVSYKGVIKTINGAQMADLMPYKPDIPGDQGYTESYLPLHMVLVILPNQDSLHVGGIDTKWINGKYSSDINKSTYFKSGENIIFTSTTTELEEFITKYSVEPGFFGYFDFKRVPQKTK